MNLPNVEEGINQFLKGKEDAVIKKVSANAIYNCHGMTFACRRTCIPDAEYKDIVNILSDDGYEKIRDAETLPGDVILYYEKGQVSHSGIFLYVNEQEKKMILSKWGSGGEYIHPIDLCPYIGEDFYVTYHRIAYPEVPNAKDLISRI